MKSYLILIFAIIHLFFNQIVIGKELFVTIEYSNGTIVKQDIIEYIEEGKLKISTGCESKCEKKAVMVLGLSGTGKTTLINYLNGVPLVCLKDPITRKWILDIAPNATSLPCGFTIGHTSASQTIYPAVYTPPDEEYSYVDNPGFQDTRGVAMEIANNFFRLYATEQAMEFKFLLLTTHDDIKLRGQQFRDTIKRFSEILGIFSEADVKNLSYSVAIVITRVENDGDTDEEMKYFLSMQLKQILIEEDNAGRLTPNEKKVFTGIIDNKFVEVFSNPKIEGPVGDKQSKQIISLIESMNYFKKEDAKFRVTIPSTFVTTIFEYTLDRYSTFKQKIQTILQQNLSYLIKNVLEEATVIEEVMQVESIFRDVVSTCSQKLNLQTFIDYLNTNILEEESKQVLNDNKKVLDFFVELLPIEMQEVFSGAKNYLDEFQLENTLNDQIAFITKLYKSEITIENEVLTINTCFIKSSDIAKEIEKVAKVRAINVYASHVVNFDISLELQNYEYLTIISPKWNVENIINIDLSGTILQTVFSKAPDAILAGHNGMNGVPGLPGKNGGHFYGFGNKFLNLGEFVVFIGKVKLQFRIHRIHYSIILYCMHALNFFGCVDPDPQFYFAVFFSKKF